MGHSSKRQFNDTRQIHKKLDEPIRVPHPVFLFNGDPGCIFKLWVSEYKNGEEFKKGRREEASCRKKIQHVPFSRFFYFSANVWPTTKPKIMQSRFMLYTHRRTEKDLAGMLQTLCRRDPPTGLVLLMLFANKIGRAHV